MRITTVTGTGAEHFLLPPPMSSSSSLLLPTGKTLAKPSASRGFHVSVRCCSSSAAAEPARKRRISKHLSYPGEDKGIAEEMRFVAMRLRDTRAKRKNKGEKQQGKEGGEEEEEENEGKGEEEEEEEDKDKEVETWQPSMSGFLKYLVSSRVVFDTIESIVDASDNATYARFRGTGLERTHCLAEDIEYFLKLGCRIPEPGSPGTRYASYLREQAESSVPSFLSHFYNIYFAHFSGGRAIGEQISRKLLDGKQLEFYKCKGDEQAMLKDIRDKLNETGEDWSRAEKHKSLRETAKCFKLSGNIVRLIIM